MNRHSNRKQKAAWAALATAAALCLALAPAASAVDFAQVRAGSGGLDFLPQVENGGFVLTVSGPDGFYYRAEFGPGESPGFSIFEQGGGVLPDGVYNYELTVVPNETQRREAFEANQLQKASGGVQARVQSGSFSIVAGSVVAGGETEPGQGAAGSGPVLSPKTTILTQNDGTIINSLCVGTDCTSAESFGFDTLRLKENNTRIKFDDTSTAAGFPSVDWQLTANDSASGGANKFTIDDISNARTPFTIEANTPSHTLYVDSAKRVGIGTSTPVVQLHVKDGNTPALRLEQDTSSGFQAQSYDVAANEANFFIRDNTTGSKLPFRLRPGAPTSSIDVAANGDVGIGTASPTEDLHLSGSDGSTKLLVTETNATATAREVAEFQNNGSAVIILKDTSVPERWTYTGGTNYLVNNQANAGVEYTFGPTGNLSIAGSLTVGPGGCSGCDLVFSPEYEVESIEEHAVYMWQNRHLPGVGPTPEDAPMNLSQKTGGILNELEKAHIYIEQLNERLHAKDDQIQELAERLALLEEATEPR